MLFEASFGWRCLENQEKSGYVLLRVEFDGSLRDGTTTTTKKGKENCQDDAEMSLHTKLE